MAILKGITREHVLKAIADLDAGIQHRWGKSRKHDLIYEGKRYPPKAVLGLAICHMKRVDDYPNNFDGGDPTNSTLEDLGFEIVSKGPYTER